MKQGREDKFVRLRKFNAFMGSLHFIQGAAMLLLSNNFSLPVTTAFLKFDRTTQMLAPQIKTLTTLRVGPMIAGFLFLSSLAHFLLASPGIYQWYVKTLKKGINPARWIEYSLSSSLMIVVISLLVGIYDVVSLLAIFFLNACMILFGWMMELHNQTTKKTNWLAYWFGVLAGAVPWIGIAVYLFGSGDGGAKPPTFVYWIFFSMFLFFNSFAINMVLQYKKIGKWSDYTYGERAYIVLSLVAKSLLAWQVFAGTLRPV